MPLVLDTRVVVFSFNSFQFVSIRPDSFQFVSIRLNSIRFDSIRLSSSQFVSILADDHSDAHCFWLVAHLAHVVTHV